LLLKEGTDPVDVYLCRKSFLDDMGMGFAKGDEIALTGSKVKQNGADLILAREVAKGSDTLCSETRKADPSEIGIIEANSFLHCSKFRAAGLRTGNISCLLLH